MKAEGSQQTKTCSFAKVAKAPETGVPISSVLDSSCGKPTRRWMRFQHSPAWKHHLHPDPGETVQPILEDGHSHNRSRLATRIWESNMSHFSN